MATPEEIFSLFEGECPTCGEEPEIVTAGGTRNFYVEQGWIFEAAHETRFWEEGEEDISRIGSATFRCPNGHEFTVEMTAFGDWV